MESLGVGDVHHRAVDDAVGDHALGKPVGETDHRCGFLPGLAGTVLHCRKQGVVDQTGARIYGKLIGDDRENILCEDHVGVDERDTVRGEGYQDTRHAGNRVEGDPAKLGLIQQFELDRLFTLFAGPADSGGEFDIFRQLVAALEEGELITRMFGGINEPEE